MKKEIENFLYFVGNLIGVAIAGFVISLIISLVFVGIFKPVDIWGVTIIKIAIAILCGFYQYHWGFDRLKLEININNPTAFRWLNAFLTAWLFITLWKTFLVIALA